MKSEEIIECAAQAIQTYLDDIGALDGAGLILALSVINSVSGAMIAKCVRVAGEQP